MAKLDWDRARERDVLRAQGKDPLAPKGPTIGPHPISEILRCHTCKSQNVVLREGTGPHAASIVCGDCRSHRWLKHTDAARAIAHLNSIAR